MKLTITNLTPKDVQMFMTLWGRLKGENVKASDFIYTPDVQDYVETNVVTVVTRMTQETKQC